MPWYNYGVAGKPCKHYYSEVLKMKKITSVVLALCLIVALAAQIAPTWAFAEDTHDEPTAGESPVEVSNYEELVEAMDEAEDGDTIGIAGKIMLPPNITLGYAVKHLTLQRVEAEGYTGFEVETADDSSEIDVMNITFDGGNLSSTDSIFISKQNIAFYDTNFINCLSTGGGAINVRSGDALFKDCSFNDNTASLGGHLYMESGILNIKNCTFTNGQAAHNGGAIRIGGSTVCTISNSTIYNNAAKNQGGGIWNAGVLSIVTTKIYGNTALNGGGDISSEISASIHLQDSDETIAELYEETGASPDGWYYDYPNRKLDTEFLPSTVPLLLKFHFQDDAPPVDPEPEEPADPDPVDPIPTEPEETPSPEPSQPSYNGGNDDGYVDTKPIEKQPTQPRLACGEAVLDPSRVDYLVGFADGASGRNMPLTRAKAVQAIFRLLTPDSLKKVHSESGVFIDVSEDDWHSVFINTLQKSGVVGGCGSGLFQPERNLTWAEMITLFTRFTNAKPDKPIPLQHWSADAVSVAASLEWMEYHSGFNPDAEVTIQEFTDFASGVLAWATTT
jgi:hypothetical protein